LVARTSGVVINMRVPLLRRPVLLAWWWRLSWSAGVPRGEHRAPLAVVVRGQELMALACVGVRYADVLGGGVLGYAFGSAFTAEP
jgi:hypothetical protein